MLIVLQGKDQLLIREKKKELKMKYYSDDFNFEEFGSTVEISEISAAMQQSPMMSEYYLVLITLNKRQFIRLKDFIKPTIDTIVVLILEDFILNEDLKSGMIIDEIIDCKQLSWKDTPKWIQAKAKSYGYTLDLDDRKKMGLLFQTTKELSDVIFQMSLLNDFDRISFLNDQFTTRQQFVWKIFEDLTKGNKKEFCTKYSEQYQLNVELTKSQFNMKLIGGFLFCLNSWRDSPQWIYETLSHLEEKEEKIIPFLYSNLIEMLPLARSTQSNIPLLINYLSILEQVKKM